MRVVPKRTPIVQKAVGAIGFAGQADTTAMEDEQMTEDSPAVLSNEEHKVLLNFVGIMLLAKSEPM